MSCLGEMLEVGGVLRGAVPAHAAAGGDDDAGAFQIEFGWTEEVLIVR